MIYAVLSRFQTCGNLRAFPLPLTRSSSILPSLSLPLTPILTLCHPLTATVSSYQAGQICSDLGDLGSFEARGDYG